MIADALYKAMKGLGTDDDLLINTLATRSPTEIEAARKAFETKYPGESLESWFKGDTSGDYLKVLLALSMSFILFVKISAKVQNEHKQTKSLKSVDKKAYYCKLIHNAVAGLGTNDDDLIRAIVSLKQHDTIKVFFRLSFFISFFLLFGQKVEHLSRS